MRRIWILKRLALACFLTMAVSSRGSGQEFSVLLPEHGLSQNIVTCIYQDTRGFIWIGTQNGLNRYDGYQFTVYQNQRSDPYSIPGNYIRCMIQDGNGDLWIGTDTAGIARYDMLRDEFLSYRHHTSDTNSLASDRILSLTTDIKGRLIIGTDKGLTIRDNNTKEFKRHPSVPGGITPVTAVYGDPSGCVWIGTDQGIFCTDTSFSWMDAYHHDPLDPEGLSNDQIRCFHQDENGVLYAGTNQGLNVYDTSLRYFRRLSYGKERSESLTNTEIYAMAEDHSGNLWVGTFGEGLIRISAEDGSFQQFKHDPAVKNSLGNDYVFSLLSDRSGLLWIGTYGGGVNRLLERTCAFNQITLGDEKHPERARPEIYALHVDPWKRLWIGTDRGVRIYQKVNDSYIPYDRLATLPDPLSTSRVYSITGSRDSSLWIGTAEGIIHHITFSKDQDGDLTFNHSFPLPLESKNRTGREINCMIPAENSSVWAGTAGGLFKLDKEGRVLQQFLHGPAQRDQENRLTVFCIMQSPDESLIVGTQTGILRLDPVSFQLESIPIRTGDKTVEVPVFSITLGADSVLWIGTDAAGLFELEPKTHRIRQYTVKEGLPDDVIYSILEDTQGNLWLSTNNGLSKATIHTEGLRATFVNPGDAGGFKSHTFNLGAYARSADHLFFFGGPDGVTWFDPRIAAGNDFAPPVFMTEFKLFYTPVYPAEDNSSPLQRPITETRELVLRHDQNLITFTFTALNYQESEKNAYACKLEGFDPEWSFPENRSVSYTNMAPGTYVFRVKASNNNGIWNENGISLRITIKPPFTQTFWFYLIMVSAILVMIVLVTQLRTIQLRKTKNELENQVRKRTMELHETNMNLEIEIMERKRIELELIRKNEELNQLLEDLRKAQAQLITSEKMASLGQLTAGIAHEINNPINFVSGNISPLARDIEDLLVILGKYEEVIEKNNLEKLFETVDQLKSSLDYMFLLEEIQKLLTGIREGASRTSDIVKGLRNFSRLDEDEWKMADLLEGIESTLLILGNRLKKGITVEKYVEKLPKILCYPGQLNQVFMNIFTNAIQAMEGEGTLTIAAAMKGQRIQIRIKDTGKGMTEDVKNRIFEPFYTTKEVGQGTGLGLSISYGIVEKHNGTLRVESEPGKGSEFIIELPVNQAET